MDTGAGVGARAGGSLGKAMIPFDDGSKDGFAPDLISSILGGIPGMAVGGAVGGIGANSLQIIYLGRKKKKKKISVTRP